MKLLDTSVAIDYLRRKPEAIALLDGYVQADEWIGASEVVRFELLTGLRSGEEVAIERFFGEIGWVPVGEAVARRAGEFARRFRPSHSGVEDGDYLIAATAFVLDAELLTMNVKHFPMFIGLKPPY